MPRLKSKAKTKNLGPCAVKRKGAEISESDEDHPSKRLRNTSPNLGSGDESSENSDTESMSGLILNDPDPDPGSDLEDDPEINVLEEDDIPHPKDEADLAHWLKLSDERLTSLRTCAAPNQRGSYHSTKIGKALSVRREQELRKAETERSEREKREDKRHGLKTANIHHFFSRAQPTIPPEPELLPLTRGSPSPAVEELIPEVDDMNLDIIGQPLDEELIQELRVPANTAVNSISNPDPVVVSLPRPSTSRVVIEDVSDEDDDGELSIEPCQLSPEAMAEEGLDELPWDPAEEVSPRATSAPMPTGATSLPPLPPPPTRPSPPASALPPGAASYFPGDQGFTMPNHSRRWKMPSQVPSNDSVDAAIQNLQNILHPRREKGRGHKSANLDIVTTARLECMVRFLRLYKASGYSGWTLHSETISTASGKLGSKTWLGRKIREWTILFCEDKRNIPSHKYGRFNSSILSDEDVAGDIFLHLQSLGKFVSAKDIVRYIATPEFQARLRIKRKITVRTAQRWMKKMGYRWRKEPRGMYSDGHEREDVVHYRQNVFLPRWKEFESRARWYKDGLTHEQVDWDARMRAFMNTSVDARVVVIWRHDESTFYCHDRRDLRWVHKSEKASIKPKGEGASQMVGDFVCDVYGWMRSKKPNVNGEYKRARRLLKAGKTREGYQTTQTIADQATVAMDILSEDYSDEKHVLAYDNATIHTARAPDALSAIHMTAKPSNNFNKVKDADNIAHCVRMRDTTFRDGTPQFLYFPDGRFKGMKILISERRAKGHDLPDPDAPAPNSTSRRKIKAECGTSFKCRHTTSTQCCLKKILYMEPDFQAQKSMLEEHCEKRGFEVIFFPKYHPELNFIEQCWGYAKRIYRMFPPSSKEEDLTRNMLEALDSVPLVSMRRFATRSSRFADAYLHGLDGADAAWANKKYRGHRTLPPSYLDDLKLRKSSMN